MASKERMTQEQIVYSHKKKKYYDAIYHVMQHENLTKDQIEKIARKISELTIHLIQNEYGIE
jgi:ethanolamine utilization protein EutA (predicted chaperonin)